MKYLILNNHKLRYQNLKYQQIFPRKLIDTTVPIYPEPDYVNQQEKSFNFRSQVNKMGGLMNTIQRNNSQNNQLCSNICNKMNKDYFSTHLSTVYQQVQYKKSKLMFHLPLYLYLYHLLLTLLIQTLNIVYMEFNNRIHLSMFKVMYLKNNRKYINNLHNYLKFLNQK